MDISPKHIGDFLSTAQKHNAQVYEHNRLMPIGGCTSKAKFVMIPYLKKLYSWSVKATVCATFHKSAQFALFC